MTKDIAMPGRCPIATAQLHIDLIDGELLERVHARLQFHPYVGVVAWFLPSIPISDDLIANFYHEMLGGAW